jgi:hypothetical protein
MSNPSHDMRLRDCTVAMNSDLPQASSVEISLRRLGIIALRSTDRFPAGRQPPAGGRTGKWNGNQAVAAFTSASVRSVAASMTLLARAAPC